MAVRAIVATVAGLGLVGAGVAGLGIAGDDSSTRNSSGQIVEAGEVGAFRIRLGDCLLRLPSDTTLQSARAVPCSDPHIYEVVGAFNVPGAPGSVYPGTTRMEQFAGQCVIEFEKYVGIKIQYSRHTVHSYIYPSKESWDQLNDREILCFGGNLPLTSRIGSIRNARA